MYNKHIGNYYFTKYHTMIAKGVGLLLLLWHHLFFMSDMPFHEYFYIDGSGIINSIGVLAKVCVPIFLILSGYGLTISVKQKKISMIEFVVKHVVKILVNYWFIWLLFVPVGVYVFSITLESVYGDDYLISLLINILGLQLFFDTPSYNATWWFIAAILGLYALFPLLLMFIRKTGFGGVLLILCLSLILFNSPWSGFGLFRTVKYSLFPFILGLYLAEFKTIEYLKNPKTRKIILIILTFVIPILSSLRLLNLGKLTRPPSLCYEVSAHISLEVVNGFLALAFLILILFIFRTQNSIVGKILAWLGGHSMDIFLFHTFYYAYWLTDIVYYTHDPIISFMTLLGMSIVTSVIIQRLKKILKLNQLIESIMKLPLLFRGKK